MLKENFWQLKKIFVLVLVELLVLSISSGLVFAQPIHGEEEKEIKQPPKSSWQLIDEAYKKGEIDLDAAYLYKYYAFHTYSEPEYVNYLPSKYRAELDIPLRAGTQIGKIMTKELEENWNKFRPETKKKLRELRIREKTKGEKAIPRVKITHPKDDEVAVSAEQVVKGIIEIPEVYEITNSWIGVGKDWFEAAKQRQEIKFPTPPEYIPGEEAFEDTEEGRFLKESYLRRKERFRDKQGLAEFYCPPGKRVYRFSEKIVLSSTGIWFISLGAENEASKFQFRMGMDYDYVAIVYPPEEKVDTTPPLVEISGVEDGQTVDDDKIYVTIKIVDETPVLFTYYSNNKRMGGGGTPQTSYNQLGLRYLEPGTNVLKVVATDSYGNVATKEIKLISLKEKKK